MIKLLDRKSDTLRLNHKLAFINQHTPRRNMIVPTLQRGNANLDAQLPKRQVPREPIEVDTLSPNRTKRIFPLKYYWIRMQICNRGIQECYKTNSLKKSSKSH